MSAMITPLHTATVGGHPLRFFKSPLNDGRPGMPWVAIDDLSRCVGLNRAERRIQMAMFHQIHSFKEVVRTVATSDGSVLIAPHAFARHALEALILTGRAQASVRDGYTKAFAEGAVQLPRAVSEPRGGDGMDERGSGPLDPTGEARLRRRAISKQAWGEHERE